MVKQTASSTASSIDCRALIQATEYVLDRERLPRAEDRGQQNPSDGQNWREIAKAISFYVLGILGVSVGAVLLTVCSIKAAPVIICAGVISIFVGIYQLFKSMGPSQEG